MFDQFVVGEAGLESKGFVALRAFIWLERAMHNLVTLQRTLVSKFFATLRACELALALLRVHEAVPIKYAPVHKHLSTLVADHLIFFVAYDFQHFFFVHLISETNKETFLFLFNLNI